MRAMATGPALGARIRTRRQQLLLTQEELARRVGVHVSTIINWEKGKHPPARHLGALEQALGISLTEPAPGPGPAAGSDEAAAAQLETLAAELAEQARRLRARRHPDDSNGPEVNGHDEQRAM